MPPPKLPSIGPLPVVFMAAVAGGGVLVALLVGKAQQVGQLTHQLKLSQGKVAQLESANQDLNQQLEDLHGRLKENDERVASLRTQLSSATTDLERSRVTLDELRDRAQRIGEERAQLQTQVVSLTSERDEAKQRLDRIEQDNEELSHAASRLRQRLALLDRDYKQLASKLADVEAQPNSSLSVISSSGPQPNHAAPSAEPSLAASTIAGTVELPPIVVRKDQAGMSLPVRGRVLDINEPHNFLIVDKGAHDGVRVGMTLDIVRGGNAVGRATVIQVRPQLSACDIVRASTPGPLQTGDTVVQSGP